MARKPEKNFIAALDIGTSKVVALVASVQPKGAVEVLGFGSHPCSGLRKGVVVNIDSTVDSIYRAVEEAELMAGCAIEKVYVGIAGSHINSVNSHGIVAVRTQEVMEFDVERVIDAAKAISISADRQILHILPQEFIIDHQGGIREPIGMSGVRLESKVHLITGAVSAIQNVSKCVERCGLSIEDIVLEQLASSYAVLSEDEKELGVCVVDIGGGTTDVAVFTQGAIRYTAVIPIAGDHVTNDIAVAFRTPRQQAEQLKIKHAAIYSGYEGAEKVIEVSVQSAKTRAIPREALSQVVSARYEELFLLIRESLRTHNLEELLTAGIVLTGGAAKVPGCVELAESIFELPVQIGLPKQVQGLEDVQKDTAFSTSVGLLLYGQQKQKNGQHVANETQQESAWGKIKRWFAENF